MLNVLIFSLIGGFIFSLLHIPIPWMLGPIVAVIIAQFYYKGPLKWSSKIRDLGVVIVGTAIGIRFNIELFDMFGTILFYMVILNIILIGGSIGIAYLTSKWTKIPVKASILGAIPGGLSQIVLFAEEEKVEEIGVISYFQVIRLLLVVVFVPFIVAGQVISPQLTNEKLSVSLVLLIAIAWVCAFLTKRIHVPVATFITPIILLITLQLTTPIAMPNVPGIVMDIAQLLIGAQIGLMLKPEMIKLPMRIIVGGVLNAIALIVLTFGSSFLMSFAMDTTFATSFLSTAPGGLDQMVLLANEVNAEVSLVSMFQTFRILFIFIIILPCFTLSGRIKTFTAMLRVKS